MLHWFILMGFSNYKHEGHKIIEEKISTNI
jgi:hypothetical protein